MEEEGCRQSTEADCLQLDADDAVLWLHEAFFSSCIREGTEISRICKKY
jgi:hypothetical protein